MTPLADQIACVRRELAMRRSAYPKWVAAGRMERAAADQEIERMAAVLKTLEWLQANEAKVREAVA